MVDMLTWLLMMLMLPVLIPAGIFFGVIALKKGIAADVTPASERAAGGPGASPGGVTRRREADGNLDCHADRAATAFHKPGQAAGGHVPDR